VLAKFDPIQRRPILCATAAVVPEPRNESSTRSPEDALEELLRLRRGERSLRVRGLRFLACFVIVADIRMEPDGRRGWPFDLQLAQKRLAGWNSGPICPEPDLVVGVELPQLLGREAR
jgi:hypothetical protein